MIDDKSKTKGEQLADDKKEDELAEELEDSFPASDPPSQTQPNVGSGAPLRDDKQPDKK